MADKKKVSEITVEDLIAYCRIDTPDENEKKFLTESLDIAKSFISGYTGVDDLDQENTFVLVVYILVQDMYDNRTLYIDNDKINKTVSTILGMHSINLLWSTQEIINIKSKSLN